jgi:hypothetical protein
MKNLFKYISVLIAAVMVLSACTTAATQTTAPATEAVTQAPPASKEVEVLSMRQSLVELVRMPKLYYKPALQLVIPLIPGRHMLARKPSPTT